MTTDEAAIAELAPHGTMRAAINIANPATTSVGKDGSLRGPSVELAHAIAKAARLPLAFVRYDAAAAVIAAERSGDAWDIAFLAVDPERGRRLYFSPPYLTIEAGYAVSNASSIRAIDEVDRPGNRVATSAGAAYDLHLQRALRFAQRVPFENPSQSFAAFAAGGFDALAGVRIALERGFTDPDQARILPGNFLTIAHAVAVPINRMNAASFIAAVMGRRSPV